MNRDIIMIGLPGSGKGSISKRLLAIDEKYVHLSTGDVFRKHISDKTELGIEITDVMNSGEFVDDELTIAVVEDFILSNKHKSIIFDGFPRTEKQLIWLVEHVVDNDGELPIMLNIHATDNVCISRIENRAIIENRKEDTSINIIRKRLSDYRDLTEPLLELYSTISNIIVINGDTMIDTCMTSVIEELHIHNTK